MMASKFEHKPTGPRTWIAVHHVARHLVCATREQGGALAEWTWGCSLTKPPTHSLPRQILSSATDLRPPFYTNARSSHKFIDLRLFLLFKFFLASSSLSDASLKSFYQHLLGTSLNARLQNLFIAYLYCPRMHAVHPWDRCAF